MKILAIETSCDETAFALVDVAEQTTGKPTFSILWHVISSQIAIHRPFGGVVPNLAKREHLKNLAYIFNQFRSTSGFSMHDVDVIGVTVGPGLEPALWTGINFAKAIAQSYNKKIIGVNHLAGHLYSFLLDAATANLPASEIFPSIGLLISGGHTMLLSANSLTDWKIIGETRDDAVGEAYDKVARLLELPYPGGPEIEKIAKENREPIIPFPRPMLNQHNFDFSFSGLKTAVLYYIKEHGKPTEAQKAQIADSFQTAAFEVLTEKTLDACAKTGAKSCIIAGGVASNQSLRDHLVIALGARGIKLLASKNALNTDNAAMIAVATYFARLQNQELPLEADGNLGF